MAIIGSLFAVAWFVIGIPFALLLGILSGLLTFIPILGPLISVIPPILLALVDDPIKALWVVLLYLAIQSIESRVVHPLVMSRAVSLHPAIVIFAIVIMGTLFGFIGLLLAIPWLRHYTYSCVSYGQSGWTRRVRTQTHLPRRSLLLRSGSPGVGCDEP
jgi:predicted PurR-regulated permease PerM